MNDQTFILYRTDNKDLGNLVPYDAVMAVLEGKLPDAIIDEIMSGLEIVSPTTSEVVGSKSSAFEANVGSMLEELIRYLIGEGLLIPAVKSFVDLPYSKRDELEQLVTATLLK